jgi:hypothetical protein
MALGGELGIGYLTTGKSGDIETSSTSTSSMGGTITTSSSNTTLPYSEGTSVFATLNTGAVFLLIKF